MSPTPPPLFFPIYKNSFNGYACRTTIIFGKLKHSNLKNNGLPLNIVSATEASCKWRQRSVKIIFLNRFFVKKLKISIFRSMRRGSNFASMCSKCVSNSVWRDFHTTSVSICNGYGKFSLRLIGSAMLDATFNLVTRVFKFIISIGQLLILR